MTFLRQKSMAIFLFSIINYQVFCMENNGDFALHRESSRQPINQTEIKVKRRCHKLEICQTVTIILCCVLISGLIYMLDKTGSEVQSLQDKVDDVFPFLNRLQRLLNNTENAEDLLIQVCEKLIPPK